MSGLAASHFSRRDDGVPRAMLCLNFNFSYKAPIYDAGVPDRSGNRRSFTGTPEQIADDVRAFGRIGVHELIFDFRGQSMAESVERLQRFASEVKPRV